MIRGSVDRGGDEHRLVKAMLLPLPSWKDRLERWIERLPRRRFVAQCIPLAEVSPVAGGSGKWLSAGNDPAFLLEFAGQQLPRGWVYLEAALQRSMGNRVAKLRFDRGHGFDEADDEFVPSNLRGSIREVLQIPADVVRIRWDPCEARGYFSQSPLVFHQIGLIERMLRMAERVYSSRALLDAPDESATRSRAHGLAAAYREVKRRRRSQAAATYQAFIRSESARAGARPDAAPATAAPLPHFVLHTRSPAARDPSWLASLQRQQHSSWSLLDWAVDAAEPARAAAGRSNVWHLILRDGDELADAALHRLALHIQSHPEALVVYTDHDFIDAGGTRHSPVFKPDWNPDLFFTHNYVANLCAISERAPGADQLLRQCASPEQLVRLVLTASQARLGEPIAHLPMVLCHRRVDPQHGDPYGGEPSQPDALADCKLLAGATIEAGLRPHTSRISWPLPSELPRVSVIIPTRDRIDLLRVCVDSVLQRTDYPAFDVLIVDNDSNRAKRPDYFAESSPLAGSA